MAWRDHLLRILAEGLRDANGSYVESPRILCALDRIAADRELDARLDELDLWMLRREFIRLCKVIPGEEERQ